MTVLALGGYVEWGGTDPKVNWVGPFEKETGCKISLKYFDHDPEAKVKAGDFAPDSFDVVSVPPDLGGRLMAEGKVAPLNTSLIENYKEIPGRLRDLPAVNQGDQVYGVPYLWGVTELLYDVKKVRPGSAGAIYADKGPIMLKDTPLGIADAALVLKRRDPGLGIKDPFQLTPSQLDAAIDLLSARKSGERTYWRDPIDVIQGFATDSVRLAQATPYHLDVLRLGRKPVKSLAHRPVTGWADSWMLSSAVAHPSCAYKWLDWTSSARVQKKAAVWNGLAPANPRACTGRTKRVCAAYHDGDAKAFQGVSFAVLPAKDCGGGRHGNCTDYTQWVERWSQLTR